MGWSNVTRGAWVPLVTSARRHKRNEEAHPKRLTMNKHNSTSFLQGD